MRVGLGRGGALVVAVTVDDVEGEADGVRWRVHLESGLEICLHRLYYVAINTHKYTVHIGMYTYIRGYTHKKKNPSPTHLKMPLSLYSAKTLSPAK